MVTLQISLFENLLAIGPPSIVVSFQLDLTQTPINQDTPNLNGIWKIYRNEIHWTSKNPTISQFSDWSKTQDSVKLAPVRSFDLLFVKITVVLGWVFWMFLGFIQKNLFASELVCHRVDIVDSYSLKISASSNSVWKSLASQNIISSNGLQA